MPKLFSCFLDSSVLMRYVRVICLLGLTSVGAVAVAAEETGEDGKEDTKKAGIEVKTDLLRIAVNWQGVLVPSESQEVGIWPEAWALWHLEEVAEHGARVKTGDVILRVRDKELDEAIAQLERSIVNAEIALAKAKIAVPKKEATAEIEFRKKEEARERAHESRDDYNKEDKSYGRTSAALKNKSAQQKLAYEQEELNQLEKMYAADDLEEETEGIVLQRQRNALEAYAHSAVRSGVTFKRYGRSEKRRTQSVEEAVRLADLGLSEAVNLLPHEKKERELALEEQGRLLEKMKEKLADYRTDRSQLIHRAKADGVVYRGKFVHGKYLPTSSKVLAPEAKLLMKQVLLTVVGARGLRVAGMVPGAQVGHLKEGMAVSVEAPAVPALTSVGTIRRVAAIPDAPGQFSVEVALGDEQPKAFVAGMSAAVSAIPVHRPDVVMIPAKFVHREAANPTAFFVWRAEGDETRKRPVVLGLKAGDKVAIRSGLKSGDRITAEKIR